MSVRNRIAALVVCAVLAAVANAQPVSRSALTEAIRARFATISSLRVVFRNPRTRQMRLTHPYVRSELILGGGGKLFLDFSHGSDQQGWEADYSRHRSYILGDTYLVDWPALLAYETRKLAREELPKRFAIQPFFRASGFWPVDEKRPAPAYLGASLSLLDAATDESYEIAEETEMVGGSKCVVLTKPSRDRIWLDPMRGYCILRREFYDAEFGRLVLAMRVVELATVADGVWLPIRFRQRYFEQGPRAPGRDIVSTVEVLSANDVDPRAFAYERRPGLFRMDRAMRQKWRQEVAGGIEYLLRHGTMLERQFSRGRVQAGPPWSWLAGIVILWISLEMVRRTRRGSAEVHV